MSSLFIFVLQVATLKIGKQNAATPFASFIANFMSGMTLHTVFWYIVSAWWFTEVYIWSSPDLSWITRGGYNTPDVLNERPIFFRVYALHLALCYAAFHIYQGNSSLNIPISGLPSKPTTGELSQPTHLLEPKTTQFFRKISPILTASAGISGVAIVVAPFTNGIFLRNLFWQLHLALAKPFFNLSRANARPIGYPPLGLFYLFQCLLAGFCLVLSWEVTSALFLMFLNQGPEKSGKPLSAASKDPNGTLLTGLKAKRDVVKTFAFWELVTITLQHKDRRKVIFEDIERPTGPIWTQMVKAGLDVLKELQLRIIGPPPPDTGLKTIEPDKPLPRLLPEAETSSILANSKLTRTEWLASPLKKFGSTKEPWRPPIEQTAKRVEAKFIEYTKPPGSSPASSTSLLDQWSATLKQSPIGWFFTQTNTAKINATVLGSPYGNAAIIVDVIEALTKMQVASLTEDPYGQTTPTVPDTVRTFTKTLNLIEGFVLRNKAGVSAEIDEVEIIIERLRASLKELLSAFQVYLIDQGLGIAELNQAKKAIRAPSERNEISEKPEPKMIPQTTSTEELDERPSEDEALRERRERRRRREEEKRRAEEPLVWALPKSTPTGPLFQRREMEQVR